MWATIWRLIRLRWLVNPPGGNTTPPGDGGGQDLSTLSGTINNYRKAHGRNPLAKSDKLTNLAQLHAAWMASNSTMSHHGWKGPNGRGRQTGAKAANENVAWRQPGAVEVVGDWATSPPHKKNLLGQWTHVGVGRVGRYWCAIFARY